MSDVTTNSAIREEVAYKLWFELRDLGTNKPDLTQKEEFALFRKCLSAVITPISADERFEKIANAA